jgi:hypothetical protein
MTLLYSAEVRWFHLGQPSAEVKEWLGVGEEHKEPDRADEYALFPGCQTTGVKLRQGRFEIKALARTVGEERFTAGVEGVVDMWAKLTFDVPDEAEAKVHKALRAAASMMEVGKARWLRKYSFDEPDRPSEVDPESRPGEGCNVEMTELRVRGSEWWSLGFEAFGHAALTKGYLRRTVALALGDRPPPCQLSSRNSMSYPAWFVALALA